MQVLACAAAPVEDAGNVSPIPMNPTILLVDARLDAAGVTSFASEDALPRLEEVAAPLVASTSRALMALPPALTKPGASKRRKPAGPASAAPDASAPLVDKTSNDQAGPKRRKVRAPGYVYCNLHLFSAEFVHVCAKNYLITSVISIWLRPVACCCKMQ